MATRRLTLQEIDTILQSIEAKRLSATINIPDPSSILFNREQTMLTLGHLSDERNGLHVRESRFDATNDKEAYPVIAESGSNTTTALNVITLTAGAPVVNLQPAAGRINTVQFIRAVGNGAFAANRQLDAYLWDGTNTLWIYNSGIAALVGTEDGLIFPTDEFTAVATYPGSRNSFDIHNGTYLRFLATGLVAAEEIEIYTNMIAKDAGGLRQ